MNKILLVLFFLMLNNYAQINELHSYQNIKLFADHLFCEGDYLRAIEEYEKLLQPFSSDTTDFKIALSYSFIDNDLNSIYKFNTLKKSSELYDEALYEKLKIYFKQNVQSEFFSVSQEILSSKSHYADNSNKLINIFRLVNDKDVIESVEFFKPFNEAEKILIQPFYDFKVAPKYKSELLAGLFSAIIPGSGKIYTEDYGDGITAFLLTGLFTYLSYSNFNNDHQFRGWLFAAVGAGFYGGSIYGSIASAQIFNAKLRFDFSNGIKLFLEDKNYFSPVYDFCK